MMWPLEAKATKATAAELHDMGAAQVVRQPPFPTVAVVLVLSLLVGALYLLLDSVVPPVFGDPAGGHASVAIMAVVVWLSSLISVLPITFLGPRGIRPTVTGYFIGAAVRVLTCIIASGVSISLYRLPPGPVMITLLGIYLPTLFVESAGIAWYLRKKDRLPKPRQVTTGAAYGAEVSA